MFTCSGYDKTTGMKNVLVMLSGVIRRAVRAERLWPQKGNRRTLVTSEMFSLLTMRVIHKLTHVIKCGELHTHTHTHTHTQTNVNAPVVIL